MTHPPSPNSQSAIRNPQSMMTATSEPRSDVAVIIVTYNSQEQIEACLSSAIQQAQGIRQEIIVVDNMSKDGTVALIKEKFPQVRLLEPGQNLGFAKACNYAAQQSQADYFLLLNPDTVVLDRAVEKVLAFARANPSYGYYGGRTLKEDGVTLERSSCWAQPTAWSLLLFATGLSTIFRHSALFDPESLGPWQRDTVREVGVITGCFLLVERGAWHAIGGFDEHYWLYGEDADLSYRAKKAGYRPVICPEAVVIHEVGQSSTGSQKTVWLHRGKVSLIKRNWRGPARPLGLLFLKTGIFFRYLLYTLAGKKDSHWVACWRKRSEWQNGHPTS